MSRWYGLRGGWINIGIPIYIAIDHKPENGCKIQNSACGNSGVMLRLLIFKSAEDSDIHTLENDEGIAHGTSILKCLCLPWDNTRCRVCADSYFDSVSSAEELTKIGLRFIGVVKTSTKTNFLWHTYQVLSLIKAEGNGKVFKDRSNCTDDGLYLDGL